MGFFPWVEENWFDLLQTAAIIGSFVSIRRDKRKEQVQNLIRFTEEHRELWNRHDTDPALWRVKKEEIDLAKSPVTMHEENFVRDIFNHFRSTFFASERGVYIQPTALPEDIRSFFRLPIPKTVWKRSKTFHDPDFVEFVESHLGSGF
jgi:hypothetical protein